MTIETLKTVMLVTAAVELMVMLVCLTVLVMLFNFAVKGGK